MRKILLLVSALTSSLAFSQIEILQSNQSYTQDFDALSNSGVTNHYSSLPVGWVALETGSSADQIYRASDGYYSGGDLYSYGTANDTDRALGTIGSGSNPQLYFACYFVNKTSDVLTSVDISFDAELWRVGNPTRSTGADTLRFAYSINPTAIDDNAAFTYEPSLFFVSPADPAGTPNIEADGNLAANRENLSFTLNVNIAPLDTIWLRWRDDNSASFDDGMGVDNLSVQFGAQGGVNTALFNVLGAMDTYYTEDFDGMASAYGANSGFSTLPSGWYAHEEGGNANQTYNISYGEFGGGNLYSYGDSASTERAFGSVGSGSLYKSHRGVAYINTTSDVIENVEVNFTGEMWRQGRPGRTTGPDTLHFSYAVNAAGIENGAYQDFSLLNFFSPVTDGILNTPMNGNAAANKTDVSGVIGNLNLQPMDTLWLRWTDYNSASFDDGLAVDDFSIAAISTASILSVEFLNSSTIFNEEDGIVQVPLVIHNKNNFLTQVGVSIANAGTTNLMNDVNIVESLVTFPTTGTDSIAYFQFNILNSDPFENQEYFVLELVNPTNAFLGSNIYDTIFIENYEYPLVPIADLQGEDVNGVSEVLGANVLIEGIVHGINYNSLGGIDFYVLENGSGLNIYSMDADLSYQPQEGDALKVWGQISQFRGLTRLEKLDSIELVSTQNNLENPLQVELLSEATEGQYLEIDSLQLLPAIAVWPGNQEVYAKNLETGDTLTLFVGFNSDLVGEVATQEVFKAIGLGSQFASSTLVPFQDGYRLMLVNKASMGFSGVEVEALAKLVMFPNPAQDQVQFNGFEGAAQVSIVALTGKVVYQGEVQANGVINLQDLAPATYVVKVVTTEGVYTNTLIKQ
ncbi:Por secretion system C-terminal sorting domain-containing protein [Lishizhenia tianjinensis]|uniref:Por secretion system C-terminal sorting domain-containing protein n=1 Tax=Lishizhenia tianjinensis TaxID=477690 RepID=A0A1I7A3L5_9FLAO|nr:T9SS type A sorting domain-containing protein [Lishizhenia tianjinensis]SFT69477.1 Por secretion system C-terminal sorting domain-containing protein [Lishizhenia tianjinensis]